MPHARQDLRYRAVQQDTEVAAYSRLVALAFARTDDEAHAWTTKLIRADLRVLAHAAKNPSAPATPLTIAGIEADPNVVGGLLSIPMGQYFGGRSIPMVGVAGVAVAPESRGRGVATSLMKHFLSELAQNSVPLSGLYAASHRLYRSVGYEQAGHRFECRIPLLRLAELMSRRPALGTGLIMRPIDAADREAIYDAYGSLGSASNGLLDRGPYVWGRIEQPGGKPSRGFLVIDPGAPEKHRIRGWVWFS
jgi:predicted N-acetyltransferase YhbS